MGSLKKIDNCLIIIFRNRPNVSESVKNYASGSVSGSVTFTDCQYYELFDNERNN